MNSNATVTAEYAISQADHTAIRTKTGANIHRIYRGFGKISGQTDCGLKQARSGGWRAVSLPQVHASNLCEKCWPTPSR